MLKMPQSKLFGYTVLVVGAIVWGAEGILVKLCYADGMSVASLLALRHIAGLPVYALLAKLFGAPLIPPRRFAKQMIYLSGLFVAATLCLYSSIELLPASIAILLFYANPTITSIICFATGRQAFDFPHLLALIFSALGLVLLYWGSAISLVTLGVILALVSATAHAIKLLYSKPLLDQLDVWSVNFFVCLASSVFYCFYTSFGLGGGWQLPATGLGWLWLILLGAIVAVCGNLAIFIGVKIVGEVDSSIIALLEPPSTAVLAFFIFREILTPWQICGGLLILLAVALPPFSSMRKSKIKTPNPEEELSNAKPGV